MSTTPELSLPPVGPLYGALYFGIIICTAIYGITCMQTFYYYVHYQNDPMRMKFFVVALWALDTIHEALSVVGIYKYIIAGLVDPYSYITINPEIMLRLVFTATIAIITQGFFVYRIYLFSGKNIIVPVALILLMIIQFVTAIAYVAKALYSNANGVQVVTINVLGEKTSMILVTITLSVAAGVDILLAIFLTVLLVRKRTSTAFSKTVHMLQRLTVFAVNTGIWTAMFALLTVILMHVYPTNMVYLVPGIPICSLYCNTLLANLNARAYIGGGETTNVLSMDLFKTSGSHSGVTQLDQQSGLVIDQQGILKTTEVQTFSDGKRSRTSEGA